VGTAGRPLHPAAASFDNVEDERKYRKEQLAAGSGSSAGSASPRRRRDITVRDRRTRLVLGEPFAWRSADQGVD